MEEFKNFNLTKRARLTLEHGEYLGDTVTGLSVYKLWGFYVLVDEDINVPPSVPSYAAVRSADAVSEKPDIDPNTDTDFDIKMK